MRVTDLPPSVVRLPSSAPDLYIPPAGPPARSRVRWPLRLGVAALVAMAASALFTDRIGDQSVLAAFVGGTPSWAAAVRAPDPGIAMSPHIASGTMAVALGDLPPTVPARKDDSRLPMGEPEAAPQRVAAGPRVRAEIAGDGTLSFAPTGVPVEAPFALVMGEGETGTAMPAPARPHGVSGGGRDHWWSDRPLPDDVADTASLRCLAEVVYFEAGNETERGQRAVAQVVLNRVKNPAYPDDICGVVYQNRELANRCQFLFACDDTGETITRPEVFARAEAIAAEYASGAAWLDEVGAATHYHASHATPTWAKLMRKAQDIGRLSFYITRDGGWT